MEEPIRKLRRYLEDVTGHDVHLDAIPQAAGNLPVFLGQIYEVLSATIIDRRYALLIFTGKKQPSASKVAKHAETAIEAMGREIAFVFPTLPAYERTRLIQKRVPFIVPGHQMYIPTAVIDLRERAPGWSKATDITQKNVSAPSQALLLHHLLNPCKHDMALGQWAEILGYSSMTLTRVRHELEDRGLAEARRAGRMLLLSFGPDRQALWNTALPCMRSPVKARSHARLLRNDGPTLLESGATALARLTSMSEPPNPVYAMSSASHRAALEKRRLVHEHYEDNDTIIIERWRYAPGILSPDGLTVDPLSLYLSLAHDPDERVSDALESLLGSMRW